MKALRTILRKLSHFASLALRQKVSRAVYLTQERVFYKLHTTKTAGLLPFVKVSMDHPRPGQDLSEAIIFSDDFKNLPVGPIWRDYSPLGEYHLIDNGNGPGTWKEVTAYPPNKWLWGNTGNWKIFAEETGKVLSQTLLTEQKFSTVIVAHHSPVWDDGIVTVRMCLLSRLGSAGLVFRYQNGLCFYAVELSSFKVRLSKHSFGKVLQIAVCWRHLEFDRYHEVKVECISDRLRVWVNDEFCFEAKDDGFHQGRVGFKAAVPTRFSEIIITTSDSRQMKLMDDTVQQSRPPLSELRKYPDPVLWKVIKTPEFGTDRNLRFGDLNGDGKLEIVLAQKLDHVDHDGYAMISCLTAIDLEGTVLWQIVEPNSGNLLSTSDLCFQVYDINGDGAAEVIFTKDFQLCIADGRNGNILKSVPTPRTRMFDAPLHRIVGDSILFCNVSGKADGPPQDILLKDRYQNVWMYNSDLELLWHHSGNTGHYPAVYDVDNDGLDEIMMGDALLNNDGSVLWRLRLGDHQDSTAIGRFAPDEKSDPLIVMACGDDGILFVDLNGRVIKHYKLGHAQKVTACKLSANLPGVQFATITFWGVPGIVSIFDCKGELIRSFEPMYSGSALSPVNWSGDGVELLLLSGHPQDGGLIDFMGQRVVKFPDDGHPYLWSNALDLTGGTRDELLV